MTTRRFEVTFVSEPIRNEPSSQPCEIIPLIHIENEISSEPPPPPPLPASLSSTNEKNTNNRASSRLLHTFLQRKLTDTRRRATMAAAVASFNKKIKRSSSIEMIHGNESTSIPPKSTSQINFPIGDENDESDPYSTTQSNNYDSNPSRITNKFLQELRTKRRELLDKSKNIGIDLRIDFHRRQNQRQILRAQDIFAVHFQINDDDDDYNNNSLLSEANVFTEESQEKIRDDIYKELNRQQSRRHRKRHQHLLLGRSLLMLMISLLTFMSFVLIYVVIDLYNRANHLDAKLPENEFIPMSQDEPTNFN